MSAFSIVFWNDNSSLEPASRQIELARGITDAKRQAGWVFMNAMKFRVEFISSALALFFGDLLTTRPDRAALLYPMSSVTEGYHAAVCDLIAALDSDCMIIQSDGAILFVQRNEEVWLSETDESWADSVWLGYAASRYKNRSPEFIRQTDAQKLLWSKNWTSNQH